MSPEPARYRVGIIGCGAMASDGWENRNRVLPGYMLYPYSHAGVYRRHPRTELVAGSDPNPDNLRAFGERWEVDRLYADHREMLERERLDLVSICTPTRVRCAVTLDVARAGVKAIYFEKPTARTLGEVDQMLDACREAGIKTAVNHYRTFDPNYHAARKLIDDGEIGTIHGAHATWLEGFSEGASHLWDMLRFFLRSELDWVFCHLENDSTKIDLGGDALLVYKNDVRAHVHMPWVNKLPVTLELLGTNGFIRMGFYQAQLFKLVGHGDRNIPVEWPFPGRNDGYSGMYVAVDQLIRAVEGGEDPSSTLIHGRATIETVAALLMSGRGHQPVHFPIEDRDYVVESWL